MVKIKLIVCLVTIGLIPVIVDTSLHNAFLAPKFLVLIVGVMALILIELWEGEND